jgi:hypothetical protein
MDQSRDSTICADKRGKSGSKSLSLLREQVLRIAFPCDRYSIVGNAQVSRNLRGAYSGLAVCLIERDLHAIGVLESYVSVAPRSDHRTVDESRAMLQQPLHCGIEIGHL